MSLCMDDVGVDSRADVDQINDGCLGRIRCRLVGSHSREPLVFDHATWISKGYPRIKWKSTVC